MKSEIELISVARILKPFGIKGEMKVEPLTHNMNRYKGLSKVILQLQDGKMMDAVIQSGRISQDLWYLRFEGIDSPEAGQFLNNAHIQIPISERLPAPKGEFYPSDLEGLKVIDKNGAVKGRVLSMFPLPTVNSLEISIQGKILLAPMIDACVGEIDLVNRTVVIDLEFLGEVLES